MPTYSYISTNGQFDSFHEYLIANGINRVAIDFEGEFNLHVYGERLCLIQIFDNEKCWAIDPDGIDPARIARFLENEAIRKYGYGSDSDKSLLYKKYGIKVKALFDLKNLVDFLGFEKKSLDAVLSAVLRLPSGKKKHFQTFNWTRRPLPQEAIEYALGDVRHLFALHRHLLDEMIKKGKNEAFADELMQKEFNYDKRSIPSIKKDYRYMELPPKAKADFERLLAFREEIAKTLDLPPDQVLNKEFMFKVLSPQYDLEKIVFSKRISDGAKNRILDYIGLMRQDDRHEGSGPG